MGQTLTHGVYLPDEGERNCYSGLAANWQLLDGAVGTIAEHTSALSGKAPLVHTHVKADITDLFNSANTWTEHNTYTKYIYMKNSSVEIGNAPSNNTSKEIAFTDKNNATLSRVVGKSNSNGKSYIALHAINKFTNGALDPNGSSVDSYFYVGIESDGTPYNKHAADTFPDANNTYDLGSSSYQWNNLYAKNYYYNGVAWGLDKVNTWTAQQKIVGNNSRGTVSIYNPAYTKGSALSSTDLSIGSIYMGDGGQQGLANSLTFISTDLAANGAKTLLSLSAMENTASSSTRTNVAIQYDKNDAVNPQKVVVTGIILPNTDATFSLGTSTNKWKTLNGVNPGALSLPDTLGTSGTENVNYFNVIGYLNNTGALATIPSTATYDGWLYINAKDGTDSYIIIDDSPASFGTSVFGNNGLGAQGIGLLCLICPIRKGHAYNVRIKSAGIVSARIYPAQGNV